MINTCMVNCDKLFFPVYDQIMLTQGCSATETSWNLKILGMRSLANVLYSERNRAPMRLCCSYATKSGPEVIKIFSYATQLNTNFILLITVKMPTIVGILTFISVINTTSERLKARNFFICRHFSFYKQLKFRAQLS